MINSKYVARSKFKMADSSPNFKDRESRDQMQYICAFGALLLFFLHRTFRQIADSPSHLTKVIAACLCHYRAESDLDVLVLDLRRAFSLSIAEGEHSRWFRQTFRYASFYLYAFVV